MNTSFQIIAHIETDFPTKFGVPRQSGIVPELKGRIVFEQQFRVAEAFRGLEDYSHIWLIWQFSENENKKWSPTVRPPKLGGNKRVGVFATRSPFRPNSLGLSSVRLDKIEYDRVLGPVLHVSGADLVDGTPIYDIKPYLPYTDSHPQACGGFSYDGSAAKIEVDISDSLIERIRPEIRTALICVLEQDPHPSYKNDNSRIYYMEFAEYEIGFTVQNRKLVVCEVKNANG
ncbi:MAG: tRNA (N6-threonylcarbamoyladenosine(37)-N6)-methyltransferase TrmO [Faecalibacterium sp.]|nr:tRNA (N6-threonylcarbamoyladenosine(37)-N6)-methyltransferase TrmO [Ruminococcus flavefaciens]MCM1392032.1 tRNA (N6-threonylcarbamoyladenosine(37)-N6)-methyltransferase TrmO [Ruminococcus sp.]MCM1484839.1 tRNA (N6-threonylcarbamoyladenosine(37)-N6)-methyltransferase TrmO [Faecalibacterium sp.]